jgi:hypothetical protein
MNVLPLIRKQLTAKEYEGYLLGRILEIRFTMNTNMPAEIIYSSMQLAKEFEEELNDLKTQRELELAERKKRELGFATSTKG